MSSLRIGFLGRVPPALGGAGLELQMGRTAAGLEELGHEVMWVDAGQGGEGFDVLHVFSTEPGVWHHLRHWTRELCPLVVSSVIVVSPGWQERLLGISARVPWVLTTGGMRRQMLARANVVVASTEYERRLLEKSLRVDSRRTVVIGNGAAPVEPGELPPGVPAQPYALLVGQVSRRKGQEEVLRAIGSSIPVVVAGGLGDGTEGLERWQRVVQETGATWLGHVDDLAVLTALRRRSVALVHLSSAEGQSLAVLEALAAGKPVIASDIPSHHELRDRYSSFVRIVGRAKEVPAALEELKRNPPSGAPEVPTWVQVAERLVEVYRRALD